MTDIIQTVLLAIVVVYCGLEQIGAIRYRRDARERLSSLDDAALAAWARLAGKQRLEESGNRSGAVLASVRDEHEVPAHNGSRESIEEALHPAILKVGSDV